MKSTALFVVPLVAIAGLVAAGCGGADTTPASTAAAGTERAAAGAIPDNTTCKERSGSSTSRLLIRNRTPEDFLLNAGVFDCSDWSGSSTPRVFNGTRVNGGEERSFTLETYGSRAPFTLQFSYRGTVYGTVRVVAGGRWAVSGPGMWEEKFNGGAVKCTYVPITASTAPDTNAGLLATANSVMQIVVRRGQDAVSTCAKTSVTPVVKV